MNSAYAAVDTYRRQQIMTASPGQLVVLLYSSARTRLRKALGHLESGERPAALEDLAKAQDIITELMATLDPRGGEISANLFRMYEYMTFRLAQARARMDAGPITEVAGLLGTLGDAWEQILRETATLRREAAGSA